MEQPDKAIEEFKRELEMQPDIPMAMMQIAYEYLKRGEGAAALPWAKQAVEAAPNEFPAHKALGEALIETATSPGAILATRDGGQAGARQPRAALRAGQGVPARRTHPPMRRASATEFSRLDRLATSEPQRGAVGRRHRHGARHREPRHQQ